MITTQNFKVISEKPKLVGTSTSRHAHKLINKSFNFYYVASCNLTHTHRVMHLKEIKRHQFLLRVLVWVRTVSVERQSCGTLFHSVLVQSFYWLLPGNNILMFFTFHAFLFLCISEALSCTLFGYEFPGIILLRILNGAIRLGCSKDSCACFNLHQLTISTH
jgi:hypothetical protein